MQNSFERILTGVVFFVLTVVFAVVGYTLLGWEFQDAIYMVVITIFGVGYGEVKPLDTASERFFTIFVIFAGFISVAYIVGGFVQLMMEGEINRALDAHRKNQDIEKLKNHVIICGFGRIGQVLTRELAHAKRSFIVIDISSEQISKAEDLGYLSYLGSASDEEVLKAVGIHRATAIATVLSNDADNVFITLTARELNPDLTILARGEIPSTEKKLKLAGADHVVLPAAISAQRITNLITRPTTIDFLDENSERAHLDELLDQINMRIDELTISPGSLLAGTTAEQLEFQGNRGFLIIAIRQADGTVIHQPPGTMVLNGGDTVIVMGHKGVIPQLARYYDLKQQLRYRGAKS
ncbi:MAG: potassium channel protein [Leptolyngbyaceae bacterium]|nr:potassium channel protein [Leptolyngbyaceae bacterium]